MGGVEGERERERERAQQVCRNGLPSCKNNHSVPSAVHQTKLPQAFYIYVSFFSFPCSLLHTVETRSEKEQFLPCCRRWTTGVTLVCRMFSKCQTLTKEAAQMIVRDPHKTLLSYVLLLPLLCRWRNGGSKISQKEAANIATKPSPWVPSAQLIAANWNGGVFPLLS